MHWERFSFKFPTKSGTVVEGVTVVATEFEEEEDGEEVFVDAAVSTTRLKQNRVSWRARQDSARRVLSRPQGRSLGSRILSLTQKLRETIVNRRFEESSSCKNIINKVLNYEPDVMA